MENKNRYQRIFLIFNHEDKGFGTGQEPTGYVKIELSEGKGKLLASVQSLREVDRLVYKLYLIRCVGEEVIPVCVGPIELQNNRAEFKWDFDPVNVGKSGFVIDEFNVAAILGESKDINSNELVCPVAAYRDGKKNWRGGINRLIKQVPKIVDSKAKDNEIDIQGTNMASQSTEEVEQLVEDVTSIYESEIQSKYMPSANAPQIESIYKEKAKPEDEVIAEENVPEEIQNEFQTTPESEENEKASAMPSEIPMNKLELEDDKAEYKPNIDYSYNRPNMRPGFCVPNKSKSASNPCESCANSTSNTQCGSHKEGNIEELRQYFEKYFESNDPFRSKRKDYRWWKVGSPVQLNNLMYQCNIKTPLLFNPAVMMAHFKYRHLIVGIYSDQIRKREFIVCGVPGIHRVDDKPFGDLCRWVQVEGSRPRYGAFGYWLVYIDGKSGKLLNIS